MLGEYYNLNQRSLQSYNVEYSVSRKQRRARLVVSKVTWIIDQLRISGFPFSLLIFL